MKHTTIEYFSSIHYLKRNAFWEMMAGVWFSFTAGIFLFSTFCAVLLWNPGATLFNFLTFLFFIYLADNCFKQEQKYKYIILTRREKNEP